MGQNQDIFFMPWIYKLSEKSENGSDYSIIASVITPSTNINEFYSDDWFWNDNSREEFKIPFTWTYTYLSWWNNVTWDMADLLWSETEFYRVSPFHSQRNGRPPCAG